MALTTPAPIVTSRMLGCCHSHRVPGVRTVELRIDQDMIDSQHVAANAGFVVAGTVTQFVPCTGETFEDLRYVLQWPPPGS